MTSYLSDHAEIWWVETPGQPDSPYMTRADADALRNQIRNQGGDATIHCNDPFARDTLED